MWIALVLSVVAIAYNNLINQWGPFHSWAYVPVNLAFAITAAAGAGIPLDLSPAELGLAGDLRDVVLPFGIVALFAIAVFAVAGSRHAHRIPDQGSPGCVVARSPGTWARASRWAPR